MIKNKIFGELEREGEKIERQKRGKLAHSTIATCIFPLGFSSLQTPWTNVEDSALCDCGLDMTTVQTCLKRQSMDLCTHRGTFCY